MTGVNRREALRLVAIAAMSCGAPRNDAAHAGGGNRMQPGRAAEGTMRKRIPSSGEEIPAIGLGTWQTFDVQPSGYAPLEEVMREFVALGGRLVDSSPMYGRSETAVGDIAMAAGVHGSLFLATKVWTSGRREGIAQMESSMAKLRAPKIDLMQVHNLVDAATHLATLREWKKEGRVRYIGVTHYTSSAYAEVESVLRRETVDFLQINYSAREREAERRILPLAQEKGIAVIANRPFTEGSLLRRLASMPLPSFAAEIDCTSWAQLLLKFVISHPAITCAIPATSKVKHLRDNLGAARGRMPDEAMRSRIAEAVG